MSINIIQFKKIGEILRESEQTTSVDLMQQALDLHYDSGRDKNGAYVPAEHYLAEDIHEVMVEAEQNGQNKLQAVKDYLKQILEPYQAQIHELYDTATN